MSGTLLSKDYPSAEEWKQLVKSFNSDAIAHKLLLAQIPYVFKDEPVKFAVFRRQIADAFKVEPTSIFIVGSAMAGRSLKGEDLEKSYSSSSDIDTLIVSESLFTSLLMESFEWIQKITKSSKKEGTVESAKLSDKDIECLANLSKNAGNGIWRPDSIPKGVAAREKFFSTFNRVSLYTLGLQLSEDTVAKVNGRVARSFEDAVADLSGSIYRLKKELESLEKKTYNNVTLIQDNNDAIN